MKRTTTDAGTLMPSDLSGLARRHTAEIEALAEMVPLEDRAAARSLVLTMVRAILVIAGLLMAQFPPAAAQVPSHKLTGQEIRSAFVGNTSYSAGKSGPTAIAAYYLPDGTHVHVAIRGPRGFTDTGTYTLAADGTFCSKFAQIRNGAEVCQSVYQIGPNVYHWVKPDGSSYDETVVPGNPEGL